MALWTPYFTHRSRNAPKPQLPRFYAHVTADGFCKQPLCDHLRNVGALANGFAKEACFSNAPFVETVHLAGLLHDLGKYREEFQELLDGKRQRDKETAHSVYGAASGWIQFDSPMLGFAVAGHHAGLHDAFQLDVLVNGTKFKAQSRFPELVKKAEQPKELGALPKVDAMQCDAGDNKEKRRYEFLTRMLFSMLVDADRLDSERFEQEHRRGRLWKRQVVPLQAELLLERLQETRRKRAASRPNDDLNRLRNAIFDTCVQRGGESPSGFFTLTVPTGGAKTLSSMAFALATREQPPSPPDYRCHPIPFHHRAERPRISYDFRR